MDLTSTKISFFHVLESKRLGFDNNYFVNDLIF